MRYTKELQSSVCKEVKEGMNPVKCAESHGLPLSIVMKWSGIEFPSERAKEIALRKYQPEITDSEIKTVRRLEKFLPKDMADDDYVAVCKAVSKTSCELVTEIVRQERNLNPHDEPLDCEIIAEITRKWNSNKFIEKYKDLCYS